jgi:glycosyltransferase involved in cell wall biosynthesis
VRPLNVVILDEELPYPLTSGKRIRTANLALRLAKRHRLTFLAHRNADPEEARRATAFLADHGIASVVVDRSVPPRSGPAFYARLAANLLSPLPYSVASHNSRAFRRALQVHAAVHPVDLWQCEWTPYAHHLRSIPNGRTVVNAQNVESVIWQRYHENETHPLRRWYVGRQWRKFQRFERRVLRTADRTVTVSNMDADVVRRDFGLDRVDVVDNGVDTTHFRPSAERRDPNSILFLGSLDWRPNLDGVRLLLDRVFPEVRATRSSARLSLVGRNPPDWLRQMVRETAGIELFADVPDVRPFLAQCGVMVVPLRIGGGSRLKILEALASGLSVVSTRVGAEGLRLEPDLHFIEVERVEDLAGALLDEMKGYEAAQERAERGRCQVLRHYDWDVLADRLERVWFDCVAQLPA